MGRKLSGRCKQEVILKRQLLPERKYVIILTEIPLVAWYYPDTKKSASHIYHGNLMEKWTSKDRHTKQNCLVKKWTYRARVIERSFKIPGEKRFSVSSRGFWHYRRANVLSQQPQKRMISHSAEAGRTAKEKFFLPHRFLLSEESSYLHLKNEQNWIWSIAA